MSIFIKICDLEYRKATAKIVPPAGVKSNGVNAATPIKPNLLRIFTAKRLVFVKRFRGLLLLKILFINSPENIINETVSIIPIVVQMAVSTQCSFSPSPTNGPPRNFNILAVMVAKYPVQFINFQIIH
jgi:hypothetical protein